MAKKVFVNGYGSIGKRIAAFISEDPEIDLIGVGKYSNDAGVSDAKSLCKKTNFDLDIRCILA